MKRTWLHLKRNAKQGVLLFAVFFAITFFLILSFSMHRAGDFFHKEMQNVLEARFIITTPFMGGSRYQTEEQLTEEVQQMHRWLSEWRKDPRVKEVIVEPVLRNGYLTTFDGVDSDETMFGVLDSHDASEADDKGFYTKHFDTPKSVAGPGDWKEARKTDNLVLHYLDCIRLSLQYRSAKLAYEMNPSLFAETPSLLYGNAMKGIHPALVGVTQEKTSDFLCGQTKIIEGRMLNEKDEATGAYHVVAPFNTFYIDKNGYRPLRIGDKIPITINDFGKTVQSELFTVVGFHNGTRSWPIEINQFSVFGFIGDYYYIPRSRRESIRTSLQETMQKKSWKKLSHIGIQGETLENLDPQSDHEILTFPIVTLHDFKDLGPMMKNVQAKMDALNKRHEVPLYACHSSFKAYQSLAGNIDSMQGVFQFMKWLSVAVAILTIPLLILFQLTRRSKEMAILQVLGETRERSLFHSLGEYILLISLSFLAADIANAFVSVAWRRYLTNSVRTLTTETEVLSNSAAIEKGVATYRTLSLSDGNFLLLLVCIGLVIAGFGLAYIVLRKKKLTDRLRDMEIMGKNNE